MKKILLLLLLTVLFLGCTSQQDINLNLDGSGRLSLKIEIHPIFQKYLSELSSFAGLKGDESFFNKKLISDSIGKAKGLSLVSINTQGRGGLTCVINFSNLINLTEVNLKNRNILELKKEKGLNILSFHLNRQNFLSLLKIMELDQIEDLSAMLPQADFKLSKEEYLKDRIWELEYYGSEDAIRKLFTDSVIKVNIALPGTVVKCTGGTYSGKKAFFLIPLLDLLVLENELNLQVIYN